MYEYNCDAFVHQNVYVVELSTFGLRAIILVIYPVFIANTVNLSFHFTHNTVYDIKKKPVIWFLSCFWICICSRITLRNLEKWKPVICKFVRRLAKATVMDSRHSASQVNPSNIGLSADSVLDRVRIFDHLTPKKQHLLFEVKWFKEQNQYRFCKSEGSRPIKITDIGSLQRLVSDTWHYQFDKYLLWSTLVSFIHEC